VNRLGKKVYKYMGKKAPTFREEINWEMFTNLGGMEDSIPTGSGELTPDKLSKKSVRWN
jgi:hypothetical protein